LSDTGICTARPSLCKCKAPGLASYLAHAYSKPHGLLEINPQQAASTHFLSRSDIHLEKEGGMPDLTQLVALGTVAYTVVNFIRYALATDWPSVFSQLLAWAAGVVMTFIVAHTDLAAAFAFGSKNLSQIGGGSQFLTGLAAASSISIVYQFTKAVDTTQSAAVPSLQLPRPAKQTTQPPA
jgi:hypothetical protein